MKKLFKLLNGARWRQWLLIVGTSTIVIGAAYGMVQQSTRLSANDVPEATAQSVVRQARTGGNIASLVPRDKIDLRKDVSSFVIIVNSSNEVQASSATLDGTTPTPPSGALGYTATNQSDWFTWEPVSGVRLAAYMLPLGRNDKQGHNYAYIVAGQSLKPFEDRTQKYFNIALAAWLFVIIWTSLAVFLKLPE